MPLALPRALSLPRSLASLAPATGGPMLARLRAAAAVVNGLTPHSQPAMTVPPVVTTGQTQPAGLTQAVRYSTAPAGFRTFGGVRQAYATVYVQFPVATLSLSGTGGNIGGGKQAIVWRTEHRVTASKIAFRVLGTNVVYRLGVNGRYADKAGVLTATSGGTNYITFDFTASGGLVDAVVFLEGQVGSAFDGIYAAPGDTIGVVTDDPVRVIFAGNSFVEGAGTTIAGDGFAVVAGELIGARDIWCSGVGSTDFINTAGGARPNLGQRLSDVTATGAWDMIVLGPGPINDIGNTRAAMTAAVGSAIDGVRAAFPSTAIVCAGPWDVSAPAAPSTAYVDCREGIRAACQGRAGVYFLDPTGVTYTKADGTHPDAPGHAVLGNWLGGMIRTSILGLSS